MKIKTILKSIKKEIDQDTEYNSIILNKYYHNKKDLLFIQCPDRNIRISKGWNSSPDQISISVRFLDENNFEQEGYAYCIHTQEMCKSGMYNNVDIQEIVQQLMNIIKEKCIVKNRLNLWKSNCGYEYDVKHGKDKINGGYKYIIKDNQLISEKNEKTNKQIERYLCDYFDNMKSL